MIDAVLDHVAVAAEQASDLWPRYAGELSGEWVGGGESPGFDWGQVGYANGMRLEVLVPQRVEENDFLRRFLDRSGPGPHHLTFKVHDIVGAIAAAEAAGYPPVSVDLDDPEWKEAFLHPKAACGIVVQLAQPDHEEHDAARPGDLPSPRTSAPARLDRVTHAVGDLAAARRLFQHLLGGEPTGEGADGEQTWVDLQWPRGGAIRLVSPTAGGPLADWIGDRPGRLHHLAFTAERPGELAAAEPDLDGRTHTVPAMANQGVRLLVSPA